MPRVSVIIPCFNHGQYVNEAVDSVLSQTFEDLEIVIIDDGSTDPMTTARLAEYDRPKTRVIRTPNQGPAAARNRGILETSGEYVLPLDADDRIDDTYVAKAVNVLDAAPDVGIVYCEAEYFGSRTGRWALPPYAWPDILWCNSIFCSAVFRRADWATVGGYRTEVDGWEDWDFWLSIAEMGRSVHRLPETLFHYRIWESSRNRDFLTNRARLDAGYLRLVSRHRDSYAANVVDAFRRRGMFERRERAAAQIGLHALLRPKPLSGFAGRAAAAVGLIAWAAYAPIRARRGTTVRA